MHPYPSDAKASRGRKRGFLLRGVSDVASDGETGMNPAALTGGERSAKRRRGLVIGGVLAVVLVGG